MRWVIILLVMARTASASTVVVLADDERTNALQLAMSIEERFGVRVPEGDEARPVFASVNSLTDYIVRAKAAA